MQLVRTTIRLKAPLKKEAEKLALAEEITFQEIMNLALRNFVEAKNKERTKKKLKIKPVDMGINLDKITRDEIYGEPDFSRF